MGKPGGRFLRPPGNQFGSESQLCLGGEQGNFLSRAKDPKSHFEAREMIDPDAGPQLSVTL